MEHILMYIMSFYVQVLMPMSMSRQNVIGICKQYIMYMGVRMYK